MSNIILPCGFLIDFRRFDLSGLSIGDLAYNLSCIRRFCGVGMSDAQHLVLVQERVSVLISEDPGFWSGHGLDPLEAGRSALLHDGTEGLGLCDLPGPLKHMGELAGYRKMERRAWLALADRFALHHVIPGVVRRADSELGKTEQQWLGLTHPDVSWPGVKALDLPLTLWDQGYAIERFLQAAKELGIR